MMLTFIFKYIWIAMLVLVYVIWGIVSIKDIIEKMRRCQSSGIADPLDGLTCIWIMMSVIVLFLASFGYWLRSIGGE